MIRKAITGDANISLSSYMTNKDQTPPDPDLRFILYPKREVMLTESLFPIEFIPCDVEGYNHWVSFLTAANSGFEYLPLKYARVLFPEEMAKEEDDDGEDKEEEDGEEEEEDKEEEEEEAKEEGGGRRKGGFLRERFLGKKKGILEDDEDGETETVVTGVNSTVGLKDRRLSERSSVGRARMRGVAEMERYSEQGVSQLVTSQEDSRSQQKGDRESKSGATSKKKVQRMTENQLSLDRPESVLLGGGSEGKGGKRSLVPRFDLPASVSQTSPSLQVLMQGEIEKWPVSSAFGSPKERYLVLSCDVWRRRVRGGTEDQAYNHPMLAYYSNRSEFEHSCRSCPIPHPDSDHSVPSYAVVTRGYGLNKTKEPRGLFPLFGDSTVFLDFKERKSICRLVSKGEQGEEILLEFSTPSIDVTREWYELMLYVLKRMQRQEEEDEEEDEDEEEEESIYTKRETKSMGNIFKRRK